MYKDSFATERAQKKSPPYYRSRDRFEKRKNTSLEGAGDLP
jgi:hypothetical protein